MCNDPLGSFPTVPKENCRFDVCSPREPPPVSHQRLTSGAPLAPEPEALSMLDEPSLSRQWIVRRLQRALSMEYRHAPLWEGMAARIGAPWDSVARQSAGSARERARAIAEIIDGLGSSPYPTFGFAQPLCSAAGLLLGLVSRRAALSTSRRASSHALAEYVGLAALADGAEGVPEDLFDAVTPLLAAATSGAAMFQESATGGGPPASESGDNTASALDLDAECDTKSRIVARF